MDEELALALSRIDNVRGSLLNSFDFCCFVEMLTQVSITQLVD